MKYIVFAFLIGASICKAQIGIGTTSPNALMDIRSSNEGAPSNTDGLLIPKIDEYPTTNPTVLQDGMMVYATGDGSVAKGFYYWDNGSSTWQSPGGAKRINDLIDGKSDFDGTNDGSSIFLGIEAGINDDGSHNYNVGIGYRALQNNVNGFRNTAIGHNTMLANVTGTRNTTMGYNSLANSTDGHSNTGFGYRILESNTTGSTNVAFGGWAMRSNLTGTANTAMGHDALRTNNSGNYNTSLGYNAGSGVEGDNNVFLGSSTGLQATGTTVNGSVLIGYAAGQTENNSERLYIENSASTSPLIYGEFDNDLIRINGTFQIGNPSTTGFQLPLSDGTVSQVLQTDGAGNTSWIDPSTATIHTINDLVDGRSDNDGTNNGSSIFLGIDAGLNDDGTNNYNIGIGLESLTSNTSGYQNAAYGVNTLSNNSTGYANTGLGTSALFNNTTGYFNSASGVAALAQTTSGFFNTATGAWSLINNTTGSQNTAVGYRAMWTTSNGDNNVALGHYAGAAVDGENNTFLGSNTGPQTSISNINGSVLIGHAAGQAELNSERLYIENSASTSPLIYGEFDNDIVGINANLGIGTQAPIVPLQVESVEASGVQNIVAALVSDVSNRPVLQFSETPTVGLTEGMSLEYDGRGAAGANRMVINGIGGNPLFEFRNGGSLTLTNGDLVVKGTATDREIKLEDDAGNSDRALMRQTGTQDIYVGDIDNNGGDLYLRAGGSDDLIVKAGTGYIGINTNNPSASLHINHPNGSATEGLVLSNQTDADEWRLYHQWNSNTFALMFNNTNVGNFDDVSGVYTAVSDRRLKKNIATTPSVLDKVQKLKVVDYNFKLQTDSKKYTGLIAQEVEKIFPNLVVPPNEESKNYTMDYSGFGVLAIKAIQEQQSEIEQLRKEIAEIRTLLNTKSK